MALFSKESAIFLSPFSKVLNLVFLLLYTFNILIRKRKIPIINVFKKYYVYFFIYTLLLFLTSLIALFFGNYHLINTKAELGVILRPITLLSPMPVELVDGWEPSSPLFKIFSPSRCLCPSLEFAIILTE